MTIDSIKTIGIIGSGTIGRGIAISSASAGYKTILNDISKEILNRSKVHIEQDLGKAVQKGKMTEEEKMKSVLANIHLKRILNRWTKLDLIIEAALEDMKLKLICSQNWIISAGKMLY